MICNYTVKSVLKRMRAQTLPCTHGSAYRCAARTPRRGEISAALVILLSVACVPELQPKDLPGSKCVDGGQIETQQLEDIIIQYSALAGQWTVDVRCPPDSATARTLGFAVETRPRSDIEFQPLCRRDVAAVTRCRISFSGQDFPELAGQSSEFDVLFPQGPGACVGLFYPEADYPCGPQKMDPSYDSTWDFLAATFVVDSTNALRGKLIYGFKPSQSSQGGMTQAGYDCISTSAVRVGP